MTDLLHYSMWFRAGLDRLMAEGLTGAQAVDRLREENPHDLEWALREERLLRQAVRDLEGLWPEVKNLDRQESPGG